MKWQESDHAFETVGTDLFQYKGCNYLVLVYLLYGLTLVTELKKTSTASVISEMHYWFLLYGFLHLLKTDGDPQFHSEIKDFCSKHRIKHEVSSPHYPKTNGLAECAVKNVKSLLKKCNNFDDFQCRLVVAWRNCPRSDGFSPLQMILGKRL